VILPPLVFPGSGLTCKHKTILEMLAWDNYSSLFQKSVNYSCKTFYTIGPRAPKRWNVYMALPEPTEDFKCLDRGKSYKAFLS
jgi:hypothetical protein